MVIFSTPPTLWMIFHPRQYPSPVTCSFPVDTMQNMIEVSISVVAESHSFVFLFCGHHTARGFGLRLI